MTALADWLSGALRAVFGFAGRSESVRSRSWPQREERRKGGAGRKGERAEASRSDGSNVSKSYARAETIADERLCSDECEWSGERTRGVVEMFYKIQQPQSETRWQSVLTGRTKRRQSQCKQTSTGQASDPLNERAARVSTAVHPRASTAGGTERAATGMSLRCTCLFPPGRDSNASPQRMVRQPADACCPRCPDRSEPCSDRSWSQVE